jgi:hypothetical protein
MVVTMVSLAGIHAAYDSREEVISGHAPFHAPLTMEKDLYSPSPEYPVACYRDDLPSLKLWHDTDGEVNRAVAPRAKAGWLRRNLVLIPRSLLRGASLMPVP